MGIGKGSKQPEAPQMAPPSDGADMTGMIGSFMTQMQGMQSQMSQMQAPELPSMPEPSAISNVDWAEKQATLNEKMSAQYSLDGARRKGRSDTVMTSPLLDDDEASITSILAE